MGLLSCKRWLLVLVVGLLGTTANAVVVNSVLCNDTNAGMTGFGEALSLIATTAADTVIFNIPGGGPYTISCGGATFYKHVTFDDNGNNVQLYGSFSFTEGGTLRDLTMLNGQTFANGPVHIENCRFYSSPVTINSNTTSTIHHNIFSNSSVVANSVLATILGNTFYFSNLRVLDNATIISNDFYGITYYSHYLPMTEIRGGSYVTFLRNWFQYMALHVHHHCSVETNTWRGTNVVNIGSHGVVADLTNGYVRITNSSTTIKNSHLLDVHVAASNCSIIHNHITTPGGALSYYSPCFLRGDDNIVRSNSIYGAGFAGVEIHGHSNRVSYNYIYDVGSGISITGNYNVINGNKIGLEPTHSSIRTVNDAGIVVVGRGNIIGEGGAGNYIAASAGNSSPTYPAAIHIRGPENLVQGNYIGVLPGDMSMIISRSNVHHGILLTGSGVGWQTTNNVIGGDEDSKRNWIAGCGRHGIYAYYLTSSNVIKNNIIGLRPDGVNFAAGNGWSGPNYHGIYIYNVQDVHVITNRISNHTNGWGVVADTLSFSSIRGNRIGFRLDDSGVAGNRHGGICVRGGNSNWIGGEVASDANAIVGCEDTNINSAAIFLEGTYHTFVMGNYVGSGMGGSPVLGNKGYGLLLTNCQFVTVGGGATNLANHIVSNGLAGVLIVGWFSNLVAGNFIGTDDNGSTNMGNGVGLIMQHTHNNTIGGPTGSMGNVIAGNLLDGIQLGAYARTNRIQGNFIGVTRSNIVRGNRRHGIALFSTADRNIIGGTNNTWWGGEHRFGNIISANGEHGIAFFGGSTENIVIGNLIGVFTNATATPSQGNVGSGIYISNCMFNKIGEIWGPFAGIGNIICNNGIDGITIERGGSHSIYHNFIGIDRFGNPAPNHGDGISIVRTSTFNTVGFSLTNGGNFVGANLGYGIYVGRGCNSTWIQGNRVGRPALTDDVPVPPNEVAGICIEANRGCVIGSYISSDRGNVADGPVAYYLLQSTNTEMYSNYAGFSPWHSYISTNMEVGIHLRGAANCVIGAFDATNWVGGATTAGVLLDRALVASSNVLDTWARSNRLRSLMIGCGTNSLGLLATNSGVGICFSNAFRNVIGEFGGRSWIAGSQVGIHMAFSRENRVYLCDVGNRPTDDDPRLVNREAGIRLEYDDSSRIGDIYSPIFYNSVAGNKGPGIQVIASRNTQILGNHIGLDRLASNVWPNAGFGVEIISSTNTWIGTNGTSRNYISGNASGGVWIGHSSVTYLRGNRIGWRPGFPVDTNLAGNGGPGVYVTNSMNGEIGGPWFDQGNLIGANQGHGIVMVGGGAQGNLICNNRIGISAEFTVVGTNEGAGILLSNAPNNTVGLTTAGNHIAGNLLAGVLIAGTLASNNYVSGNTIGRPATNLPAPNLGGGVDIRNAPANLVDENIIAGNHAFGVRIANSGSPSALNNIVRNNRIGNDGVSPIPNLGDGVLITNASFTYIGANNVIGGNTSNGVAVIGTGSHDNFIQGNHIGVWGTNVLSNSVHGVLLFGGDGNWVGGTNSGEGNMIAHNGWNGVFVARGVRNRVLGNSIFMNAARAVRLGTSEVYAAEQDGLPNRNQRPPLLTNVYVGSTYMYGTFTSGASQPFLIECFYTPSAHPQGFGEGRFFIGRVWVTNDADGTIPIAILWTQSIPVGSWATVTATDTNGNSSAFSTPVVVTAGTSDSDGDGMPDGFEAQFGLDPNNPADAMLDSDGDGFSNLMEYIADTIPTNPSNYFRVAVISNAPMVHVTFSGSAARVYTLEVRTNLIGGAWVPVPMQVDVPGSNAFQALTHTNTATTGFYRVSVELP
ncbi:MAG: right-handed parallel beta-helix repeat-containing protein [Kiritimatiellae bacterium]|nr:right-handed parallel beta-helix repeat-containing protein [Kiritimatiellia bacterium]MDW8459353.1 right-handed parallel beta-helix repeat-containing protein [Verrucomicrobiota bacterium]